MTDTATAAQATTPAAPAADAQVQAPAAPVAPAAPSGTPTPAELAARTQAPAQPQTPAAEPQGPDMTGWPQEARDAYTRRDNDARRYQREAGDSRIQSKANAAAEERQSLLAALTAVLNPEAAKPAASVEEVTQQLTSVQEQANAAARQAALVQAAWEARVDPAKLDYLGWKLDKASDFSTLDPKADDFRAKVSAAVAAQLAADPTLGAAGTVQASGTETHGGASTGSALTQEAWDALPVSERTRIFQTDRQTYDRMTGRA